MTEALAGAAYRGVMSLAAGAARLAAVLPGAPAGWRRLGDRLGRLPAGERGAAASRPALWIHAASVGELAAVRPLLAPLRARFPGRLLLLTTTTRTGLARAQALPEAHLATLLPLDAPGPVAALVEAFRLEGFLFTETEIWPTLLTTLAARKVPALMVSGRVSPRSASRAALLRPLYRRGLATVTCCMQTPEDAARVVALGADPRRVQVAGSLKYDVAPGPPPAELAAVATALAGRPVVVAGSTHAGEEEALCDAFVRLAPAHPGLVVVLAPRHPERFDGVAALVEGRGLPLVRWATLGAGDGLPDGPAVVLLDALGVLPHVYELADVVFVGGTLVPVGGHNPIEPARAARPVLVGPHTTNAAEAMARLLAAGGAEVVDSAAALTDAVGRLLGDPAEADAMGARAEAAVAVGQGAVERHMKIIAARLEQAGFARGGGDDR